MARSVGAGAWSRRRVLAFGLGGVVAAAVGGVSGIEFVSHGVLPGKTVLDRRWPSSPAAWRISPLPAL